MNLLLAHDNAHPFLEDGPSGESAADEAETVEQHLDHLADLGENANDLAKQRWAVIAPEGDRLLSLARPLIDRRSEQQKAPAQIIRVPPGMDAQRAIEWKRNEYPEEYTPAEARERQGAMHFGTEGAILPCDISEATFLPGGLWFYFACFGAGTPSESAYHHWMTMLEQNGMKTVGPLGRLLADLSTNGGFTSGIARAALANPNGPLAMIGHLDLAWSYSYDEIQVKGGTVTNTNRAENFYEILAKMVKGNRVGMVFLEIQRILSNVSKGVMTQYNRRKRHGGDTEGLDAAKRLALGNLWMLYQDLCGYVLLGDPAVRLPLAKADKPRRRGGLRAMFARTGRGSRLRMLEPEVTAATSIGLDSAEQAFLEEALKNAASEPASSKSRISPERVRRWHRRRWDKDNTTKRCETMSSIMQRAVVTPSVPPCTGRPLRDVKLGDFHIPAGALVMVMVMVAATSWDPTYLANPQSFDLGRSTEHRYNVRWLVAPFWRTALLDGGASTPDSGAGPMRTRRCDEVARPRRRVARQLGAMPDTELESRRRIAMPRDLERRFCVRDERDRGDSGRARVRRTLFEYRGVPGGASRRAHRRRVGTPVARDRSERFVLDGPMEIREEVVRGGRVLASRFPRAIWRSASR